MRTPILLSIMLLCFAAEFKAQIVVANTGGFDEGLVMAGVLLPNTIPTKAASMPEVFGDEETREPEAESEETDLSLLEAEIFIPEGSKYLQLSLKAYPDSPTLLTFNLMDERNRPVYAAVLRLDEAAIERKIPLHGLPAGNYSWTLVAKKEIRRDNLQL